MNLMEIVSFSFSKYPMFIYITSTVIQVLVFSMRYCNIVVFGPINVYYGRRKCEVDTLVCNVRTLLTQILSCL